MRSRSLACLLTWPLLVLLARACTAQTQQAPIPDIVTLMKQVQAHQRDLDTTREAYTFHERQVISELDRSGAVKKVQQRESEVFFVHSHQVERLVSKDGHALTGSDEARETERVKKEIEKAQRTPPGEMVDESGQISVSRLLSIEKFSNARRVTLDRRSVLAFDFIGDPSAQTHGVAEKASRNLAGTLWIDEQDRQVRRVQATLEDSFRAGFGLFTLSKGSSFSFDQKLVNGELWLPTSATVHLEAHAVGLISYRANVDIQYDNYQRFRTDSEQGPVTVAH